MADKIDVDVTGKSKYEVAEAMARIILMSIEDKSWKGISRSEYLKAVQQSILALQGYDFE